MLSSTWKFVITMAPPSNTPTALGKPSPANQICVVSLEPLHCAYCKKTGHFCSKFHREKSIFECMIGARRFVCFVICLSNECNNGHLSLRQVTACCFSTNEFLLEIVWLYFWRCLLYTSKLHCTGDLCKILQTFL
jgi:hypothetical protein